MYLFFLRLVLLISQHCGEIHVAHWHITQPSWCHSIVVKYMLYIGISHSLPDVTALWWNTCCTLAYHKTFLMSQHCDEIHVAHWHITQPSWCHSIVMKYMLHIGISHSLPDVTALWWNTCCTLAYHTAFLMSQHCGEIHVAHWHITQPSWCHSIVMKYMLHIGISHSLPDVTALWWNTCCTLAYHTAFLMSQHCGEIHVAHWHITQPSWCHSIVMKYMLHIGISHSLPDVTALWWNTCCTLAYHTAFLMSQHCGEIHVAHWHITQPSWCHSIVVKYMLHIGISHSLPDVTALWWNTCCTLAYHTAFLMSQHCDEIHVAHWHITQPSWCHSIVMKYMLHIGISHSLPDVTALWWNTCCTLAYHTAFLMSQHCDEIHVAHWHITQPSWCHSIVVKYMLHIGISHSLPDVTALWWNTCCTLAYHTAFLMSQHCGEIHVTHWHITQPSWCHSIVVKYMLHIGISHSLPDVTALWWNTCCTLAYHTAFLMSQHCDEIHVAHWHITQPSWCHSIVMKYMLHIGISHSLPDVTALWWNTCCTLAYHTAFLMSQHCDEIHVAHWHITQPSWCHSIVMKYMLHIGISCCTLAYHTAFLMSQHCGEIHVAHWHITQPSWCHSIVVKYMLHIGISHSLPDVTALWWNTCCTLAYHTAFLMSQHCGEIHVAHWHITQPSWCHSIVVKYMLHIGISHSLPDVTALWWNTCCTLAYHTAFLMSQHCGEIHVAHWHITQPSWCHSIVVKYMLHIGISHSLPDVTALWWNTCCTLAYHTAFLTSQHCDEIHVAHWHITQPSWCHSIVVKYMLHIGISHSLPDVTALWWNTCCTLAYHTAFLMSQHCGEIHVTHWHITQPSWCHSIVVKYMLHIGISHSLPDVTALWWNTCCTLAYHTAFLMSQHCDEIHVAHWHITQPSWCHSIVMKYMLHIGISHSLPDVTALWWNTCCTLAYHTAFLMSQHCDEIHVAHWHITQPSWCHSIVMKYMLHIGISHSLPDVTALWWNTCCTLAYHTAFLMSQHCDEIHVAHWHITQPSWCHSIVVKYMLHIGISHSLPDVTALWWNTCCTLAYHTAFLMSQHCGEIHVAHWHITQPSWCHSIVVKYMLHIGISHSLPDVTALWWNTCCTLAYHTAFLMSQHCDEIHVAHWHITQPSWCHSIVMKYMLHIGISHSLPDVTALWWNTCCTLAYHTAFLMSQHCGEIHVAHWHITQPSWCHSIVMKYMLHIGISHSLPDVTALWWNTCCTLAYHTAFLMSQHCGEIHVAHWHITQPSWCHSIVMKYMLHIGISHSLPDVTALWWNTCCTLAYHTAFLMSQHCDEIHVAHWHITQPSWRHSIVMKYMLHIGISHSLPDVTALWWNTCYTLAYHTAFLMSQHCGEIHVAHWHITQPSWCHSIVMKYMLHIGISHSIPDVTALWCNTCCTLAYHTAFLMSQHCDEIHVAHWHITQPSWCHSIVMKYMLHIGISHSLPDVTALWWNTCCTLAYHTAFLMSQHCDEIHVAHWHITQPSWCHSIVMKYMLHIGISHSLPDVTALWWNTCCTLAYHTAFLMSQHCGEIHVAHWHITQPSWCHSIVMKYMLHIGISHSLPDVTALWWNTCCTLAYHTAFLTSGHSIVVKYMLHIGISHSLPDVTALWWNTCCTLAYHTAFLMSQHCGEIHVAHWHITQPSWCHSIVVKYMLHIGISHSLPDVTALWWNTCCTLAYHTAFPMSQHCGEIHVAHWHITQPSWCHSIVMKYMLHIGISHSLPDFSLQMESL